MNLIEEFPLDPAICYLNHAGVAPWPKRTVKAVETFAQENLHSGAWRYDQWLQVEAQLKQQLANLINAPDPADIALLKNTSEGLSTLAFGLEWSVGDNVITIDQEFPSNRIIWQALEAFGVETRFVDLFCANPETTLIELMDRHTRLVSVSSTQYATGHQLDLRKIGQACKNRGIIFCVDAIQSIGCSPFDAQAIFADCVCADGHKWMLGPEGVALFYTTPQLREQLKIRQYGWHMIRHRGNYESKDWQPADDATRFECGSPNMLGIHALQASTQLLLNMGMEKVNQMIDQNIKFLTEKIQSRIGKNKVEILSPPRSKQNSGILTCSLTNQDNLKIQQQLQSRGVICAYRGGGVRFSPHFYTCSEVLKKAVDHLSHILSSEPY